MKKKITRRKFVQGAAAAAPLAFTPMTFTKSAAAQPGGDRFDVLVIGAGHNSLVTAAYMAKAGFRTVVLEGRPEIGGGAKHAELTLRGFKHDTCSANHANFLSNPAMKELKLADYGLEYFRPDPIRHNPFPDGTGITIWKDFDRTYESIAQLSKKDAETYRRMADEADEFRKTRPSGRERGIEDRPIGWEGDTPDSPAPPPSGMWQRRMAMSKWAVIRHNFEHEHVQTFMIGGWPVDLNQHNTGLRAYPTRNPAGPATPKGGAGMLPIALARCIEAHGGVILTNKPTVQLIIEGGRCVGVECADGSTYRASRAVVSTVHIKRLVDLAPKGLWGEDFLEGVATFNTGSSGLNTLYATTSPVVYPAPGGGTVTPVHSRTLYSPVRALHFDLELHTGEVDMEDCVLHVVQPSVVDVTRAPEGMHTVRVLGRQPYNLLDGGPQRWDEIKEKVADAHLRALQRHAPSLTDDKILARFVISPLDIERMNPGMWHGSCHGGTDGPAQRGALRPVPGWAQHRMPIPGLYQTGGTTHPEGGVRGRPGRNAAMVILKDLGTSLEQATSE